MSIASRPAVWQYSGMIDASNPENFLHLARQYSVMRLAVARLGERDHAGWWNSIFLSDTGLQFSVFNFQRAPIMAAYTAAGVAAKRMHDDRIGRSRSFHLFRLPLSEEIRIREAVSEGGDDLFRAVNLSSADLMKHLEVLADGSIDAPAGPVQVGTYRDAFSEAGLGELAKHYLSAFRQGVQTLPYFAEKSR